MDSKSKFNTIIILSLITICILLIDLGAIMLMLKTELVGYNTVYGITTSIALGNIIAIIVNSIQYSRLRIREIAIQQNKEQPK